MDAVWIGTGACVLFAAGLVIGSVWAGSVWRAATVHRSTVHYRGEYYVVVPQQEYFRYLVKESREWAEQKVAELRQQPEPDCGGACEYDH